MPSEVALAKKQEYIDRLIELIETYPQILVVQADNVGSNQMAQIRRTLRGKAVILMGKNTIMRNALKRMVSKNPHIEKLLPLVRLNVGFVFCIDSPVDVRKVILENKVPAPARQGLIAPLPVFVPPGPTGMDPSQTSFFQALGISTKIFNAQIEIQSEVNIIKKGDKVTASQSVLLQKLNIRPFSYGLIVLDVYDNGQVYDSAVMDITETEILNKFRAGVRNVAALSREICIPTEASTVHCVVEAFKYCTAMVLESDYTFPQMENLKEFLKNPGAFAVAAPAAAAAPAAGKAKVEEKVEEAEDEDMGFSLFD